ncbi:MAG: c-type cytochrome, partial [Aurantibacter sp.]
MRTSNKILSSLLLVTTFMFFGCTPANIEGSWDYKLSWDENNLSYGVLKIENDTGTYSAILNSFQMGKLELQNLEVSGNNISGSFEKWDNNYLLTGRFSGDTFKGNLTIEDEIHSITARRQSNDTLVVDRSNIKYILSDNDLEETELNIDHAGIIEESFQESFERGERIYNSNCINCHGNPEIEGSIPLSLKFWEQAFKAGNDPYSMYQSISRGYATMPPQLTLSPREKYDVITYIREEYVRGNNPDQYFNTSVGYLSGLPEGTSKGPEPKPYHPWSDQDYGNFFINTYELVDAKTGAERYHSPGPTPY